MQVVMTLTECVALGLLGGGTYALIDYYHRKRTVLALLTVKKYILRIVLGGIVGLLFYLSGFPNHLNCFICGYCAPDFLAKLVEKKEEE